MKKKNIFIPVMALGLIVGLVSCGNNQSTATTTSTTSRSSIVPPSSSKEASGFTINSPFKGEEIDIANHFVRKYLNNYKKGCSSSVQGFGDVYQSKEVTLSWDFDQSASSYTVKISKNPDLSNSYEYITLAKHVTLKYLDINQTYYWNVSANNKHSETYNFTITDGVRTLDVDGVSNGRDIGGKKNLNGKTIKQGLVYRSAALDDISSIGLEAMKYDLRIKTDLDLRNPQFNVSPLGSDVKLVKSAFPYWYDGDTGINKEANWPIIKTAIDTFADATNYPIDFHCAIGQDRTGTLAIFLESILGLDEKSISMDYEMSSFSSVAGDAKDASGNIIRIADKWTFQVTPTIDYLKTFSGSNLAECTVTFLKEKCGVTDTSINAIRDIMLED